MARDDEKKAAIRQFKKIHGIGKKTAQKLVNDHGLLSVEALGEAIESGDVDDGRIINAYEKHMAKQAEKEETEETAEAKEEEEKAEEETEEEKATEEEEEEATEEEEEEEEEEAAEDDEEEEDEDDDEQAAAEEEEEEEEEEDGSEEEKAEKKKKKAEAKKKAAKKKAAAAKAKKKKKKEKKGPEVGPITQKHVCTLCGEPIFKNSDSWRGRMSRAMILAILEEHPDWHPKMDICKPCGEKWAQKVPIPNDRYWFRFRL